MIFSIHKQIITNSGIDSIKIIKMLKTTIKNLKNKFKIK